MSESQPPADNWRTTMRKITSSQPVTIFLALVVALVVGAVLIAAADPDVQTTASYLAGRPSDFFSALGQAVADAYSALFQGAVFNFSAPTAARFFEPLTKSIAYSVPLIFAGLALGVGFRAGLFNIGAQGQIILGGVICGYIGFSWHLPPGLHLVVCILGAFIGGALWGFVPGILKAKTGANEVIVTIMLNSVAGFLLGWLLTLSAFHRAGSNLPISPMVDHTATYPSFFGSAIDLGFVLALATAFGVWWMMERSTLGFRIRAVGENPDAARTAGMSVQLSYVWVMVISGGLAGLAVTSQLLAGVATQQQQLNTNIAATFGFDAITVALLGRSKPLGTVLAAFLMGALRAGGYLMQAATRTPIDIILVVQSVVVLLIAAPPLVRAIFRLPDPERRGKRRTKVRANPGAVVEEVAAA